MAASVEEKDYVHVLMDKITNVTGTRPQMMVENIFEFEQAYSTYDIATGMKLQLDFEPDIVVLAIGENVPGLGTSEAAQAYKAGFARLLSPLQNTANDPAIFVRSCFWADSTKDTMMQQATQEAGEVFINIGALDQDPLNYASSERTFQNSGVGVHPGDRGMQAIADAIFGAMVTASVPEPGSVALLVIGSLVAGGFFWRRRR